MDRSPSTPIVVLVTGLLLIAIAYAGQLAGHAALAYPKWSLALGASLVLTGMLALAARRPGGTPRALQASVWLTCLATFGGLAYALAAPAPAADGPLLFGLPRVTAIMLLVTGFVPLVLLPLAYARAFGRDVLRESDIARIAAMAREAASPAQSTFMSAQDRDA